MTKFQKTSNLISTVNEIATIARNRNIAHLYAQDTKLDGRHLTISNRKHVNFGSCSYLGLEFDSRLVEGGIDGIRRFGAQFSSSRTYVSIPLYEELEEHLKKMFGRPVILSSCSTLGHHAVMPIIIEEGDAVILDQQAHVSMQDASSKLNLRGNTITILRHNRLDDLQMKIEELSPKHDKIWYCIDGIYSMYGDLAPIQELLIMLEKNKQLYLYIDDAHGMSWTGIHGSGFIRSQINYHPRVVLATSLAKGFASAGGVFVLPTEEMYWKVKNWGGPLTYSGPQQPAVLGASIASAKIHLSNEINELQKSLADKISFCNEALEHYELPLVSNSISPIFFIGLGLTKVGYNMVQRLSEDGFYVNLGIFPAVPESCTGLRFTITNHHSLSDIEALAERINYHLPKALQDENRTRKDIHRAFKSLSKKNLEVIGKEKLKTINKSNLTLQHETSIHSINEKEWNELLADNGSFDWRGLSILEESFSNNEKPEDNWSFHYYIIRDQNNKPVIATFFTSTIVKDDMLAPGEVSMKIEKLREADNYYLTSKTFMMGCVLTDGTHLYIDKSNSNWKEGMMILLDEVWAEQERENAPVLYLRDFSEADLEMRDFMCDQGFIKVEVPDSHILENKNHSSREEFISLLPHKKRYHVKQDVFKYQSNFELKIATSFSEEEIEHWYKLYENVCAKNLDVNLFKLPKKLFYNFAKSNEWEVLLLNFKPEQDVRENKLPLAVGFAYKNHNYCPTVLGIDYEYLNDYKIYKQILYQTILRALDLNADKIYLGLSASLEKRKMGANSVKQVAYIQIKDNYNMSLINIISNSKK